MGSNEDNKIKVCARFRGLNEREKNLGGVECMNVEDNVVVFDRPGKEPLRFDYDAVFDTSATQEEVFEGAVGHMIDDVLSGKNCTVFAYGQTGSGKTYTMEGDLLDPEYCGIVPRLMQSLFEKKQQSPEHIKYTITVSYLEIYMEIPCDLLWSPKKKKDKPPVLKIRQDKMLGTHVSGLVEREVRQAEDVLNFHMEGSLRRTTFRTKMNPNSSRSHGVFCVNVRATNQLNGSMKYSKLLMVDLAGSERAKETGATGRQFKEGQIINQSLTNLNICLKALSEGSKHVPYRNSVLTKVLADALGGNSKTTLIVCCSSSGTNFGATRSTLDFASRAKKVVNNVKKIEIRSSRDIRNALRRNEMENHCLKRLVYCLHRDLEMACNNQLQDPSHGLGVFFQNSQLQNIDFTVESIDDLIENRGLHVPEVEEVFSETVSEASTIASEPDASTSNSNLPHPNHDSRIPQSPVTPDLPEVATEALRALEYERDELLAEVAELRSRNTSQRSQICRMTGELMVAANALDQEKLQVQELEAKNESVTDAMNGYMHEARLLTEEIRQIQTTRDMLFENELQHTEEIDRLKDEISQLNYEHEKQIEKVKAQEAERITRFIESAKISLKNKVPESHSRSNSRFSLPGDGVAAPPSRRSESAQLEWFVSRRLSTFQKEEKVRELEALLRERTLMLEKQLIEIENFAALKRAADEYHLQQISELEKSVARLQSQNAYLKKREILLENRFENRIETKAEDELSLVSEISLISSSDSLKRNEDLIQPISEKKQKNHARNVSVTFAENDDVYEVPARQLHYRTPSEMFGYMPLQPQYMGAQYATNEYHYGMAHVNPIHIPAMPQPFYSSMHYY